QLVFVDTERDGPQRHDLELARLVHLPDVDELDHGWRGRDGGQAGGGLGLGAHGATPDEGPPAPPPVMTFRPPGAEPDPPKPAGSRMTTCSPSFSPWVISTMPLAVEPVFTVRGASRPVLRTVTVDVPFVVVTARAGTCSTLSRVFVAIAPVTVEPTKICLEPAVNATVTGYWATPVLAVATCATSVTVPVAVAPPAFVWPPPRWPVPPCAFPPRPPPPWPVPRWPVPRAAFPPLPPPLPREKAPGNPPPPHP